MGKMQVVIVTPERTTFDKTVDGVVVPLLDGETGILAGHSPLIGRLAPGEVRISDAGQTTGLYVDGGFVQVVDNVVSILTGRAISISEIDVTRARETLASTRITAEDRPEIAEMKEKAIAQAQAQIRLASR